VVALTQLTPHAGPGRRYGSFAGKESTANPSGPHNPGTITQLRPYAGPGGRYGSFAGKEESGVTPTPTHALDTGAGGGHERKGRDRHDRPESPFRIVSVDEYWGLDLPRVKAELKREAEIEIQAADEPPTKTQVRKIVAGLLDGFPKPQRSKAPDVRRMRAELQALRAEIAAYAEAVAARRREEEDEEDDVIGILLQ